MKKFNSFMEEKFVPVATKISSNRYLKAISGGSMSLMTVIMIGAVFSLLGSISIEPYQNFLVSSGIGTILAFVPKVTTEMMAIYMVFSIAYNAATIFGYDDLKFENSILAVVGYLLLLPLQEILPEGAFAPDILLNLNFLGAKGAFLAIITAIVVTKIYGYIVENQWTIKMPNGVPEQVSKAFTSLIPAVIILSLFAIIKYGFTLTTYNSAGEFIYTLLQTPLQNLTSSLPAFIIIVVLAQILWFFGVHGSMTVLPIFMPIWMGYMAENSAAFAASEAVPHIFNVGLYNFTTLGGAGATLGFVIVMFFFAKSKRYKAFSKMVTPLGLFNVNEPVVFGMPIMLNPVMFLPFVITPLIVLLLGYTLISLGIMPTPVGIMIPASTPPIISGLMQGSWKIALFEIVAIIMSALIYYPFFRILDRQALEEESKANLNSELSK